MYNSLANIKNYLLIALIVEIILEHWNQIVRGVFLDRQDQESMFSCLQYYFGFKKSLYV